MTSIRKMKKHVKKIIRKKEASLCELDKIAPYRTFLTEDQAASLGLILLVNKKAQETILPQLFAEASTSQELGEFACLMVD